MGSRIDPNYGKWCRPTFGPESNTPSYFRKTGGQSELPETKDTEEFPLSGPGIKGSPGAKGKPPPLEDRYKQWCTFWGTKPNRVSLGVPDVAPDLSPSKALYDTLVVDNQERQLRHDLDEDRRWFKNHTNQKPEKVVIREKARRAHSVLELSRIEHGDYDGGLVRNFNKFGQLHQPHRPRRLENFGSPSKVWTPRARPKTPAPIDIVSRLGKVTPVAMPNKYDRDPHNPDRKDMKHHVFGFLSKSNFANLQVRDEKKSAEYDRQSNFKDDRRVHARRKYDPKETYSSPVATSMEVGWDAADKETYQPICGTSPAIYDQEHGLPRLTVAGGTPGRLASQMSKFVDNVLMTKPGFNPF